MWRYKDHIEAKFGIGDEELCHCQERITRIDYKRWKTFYYGDPEHWTICENSNYTSGAHPYRLPVYKINKYKDGKHTKWEYRYIKFLTPEDYRCFNFFIDELDKKGEDWQNLHEIEELAEIIGKISAKRLEEVQKRTQQAYDENQELLKKVKLKMKEGDQFELPF